MFSLLQKCVCPISLTKTQRFFTNSSVCKSKFLYKNPLYYTKQHLTLNINGPYVKLGITTYLRDCLGEITLLKPDYEIGDYVEEGEVIYNIESLKATNEILSPLNGELINVNNQLIKNIKYIQYIEKEDDLWLLEFKWNEVDTEIFMDKDKYDWFTKPRI
jgi:glycine cleavage system H protein